MQIEIDKIEMEIKKVKVELQSLGPMRPGTLTLQYRNPKEKKGGFYQLSYTHKMKSKTEYVRAEFVEVIKKETENYRRFKALTEKWSELALKFSQLKILEAKEKKE